MAETTHTETQIVHTETHHEPQKSTLISDILSIVGFAILFIILLWGLIHLVSLSSPWFSSLFSRPAASIEVSVPASASSGEPANISWTYAPHTKGSYAFVYACKTGLQFETQNGTSTYATIPCGSAFSVASNNNSLSVVPTLSGTSSATDAISIVFIPSTGNADVQGNATLVVNASAVKAAATPVKPAVIARTYSGPADLSVRIISASVDGSGAGVVSFDIANVGGSPSGTYYFSAQLPTAQNYPYVSPAQASLAPDAHIVDTLRFTDVASGGGTFSVSVSGNDANYANNTASTFLNAPYTNYTDYGSYNSAPYVVYPTYTY